AGSSFRGRPKRWPGPPPAARSRPASRTGWPGGNPGTRGTGRTGGSGTSTRSATPPPARRLHRRSSNGTRTWQASVRRSPGPRRSSPLPMLLAVTPLNILNYVVSPIVAERHGRDRPEDIQSLLRASATAAAVPSLVVLAVCIFAGGPVLSLVYGPF